MPRRASVHGRRGARGLRPLAGWVGPCCGWCRRGTGSRVPVRAEGEFPAMVVDAAVVPGADGEEVAEIGAPAVAPPFDVVELAAREPDSTSCDRVGRVQCPRRPSLGSVRQAHRAPEVELARCVDHDPVADHDGVDDIVAGELGEDSGGDLDSDAPVDRRSADAVGFVAVDHDDVLRAPRTSATTGLTRDESFERQRPQVVLLQHGIGGSSVRRRLCEQFLQGGLELRVEANAGDRIEAPVEAPHSSPSVHTRRASDACAKPGSLPTGRSHPSPGRPCSATCVCNRRSSSPGTTRAMPARSPSGRRPRPTMT